MKLVKIACVNSQYNLGAVFQLTIDENVLFYNLLHYNIIAGFRSSVWEQNKYFIEDFSIRLDIKANDVFSRL